MYQRLALSPEEDELSSGPCTNPVGMVSCSSKNCRNFESCPNPVTRYLRSKSLTHNLVPRESRIGWGLNSNVDIDCGEIITEYIGEFSSEARDLKYSFKITDTLFLSALVKGNSARFINHACKPNSRAELWSVDGFMRVFIFAERLIPKSTFITLKYGNEYCFQGGCQCDSCYSK